MKCPEDAITSPVDWLIMAPFMNYNVRMGIKNRSIDKVKVVHSKGKTVRIDNTDYSKRRDAEEKSKF
jgi:hypothetical protein